MIRYILIVLGLLWSQGAKGQFAVSDMGVVATIGKQIKEIQKSTQILIQSGESLQKVKDALEKGQEYLGAISKVVTNAKYLDKFLELNHRAKRSQERTTRLVSKVYGEMSQGKLSALLSTSVSLVNALNSDITLIQDILKPFEKGGPKMSDFERLTFLDRKLEETQKKTALIEYQEQDLLNIASLEQVLNRIK